VSTGWDAPDTRPDRHDGRVTALTFLVPAAFGLHALLVPWVAVDDDGADEVYDWWQTGFLSSVEESAYPAWFWVTALLGVLAVGIALVRASSVDAAASWWQGAAAGLLALALLALPFVLRSALPEGEDDVSALWGGPLAAAAAAAWLAGACLTGAPREERPGRRSGGWWRERGF
jgi:hypothetical protein